MTSIPPAGFAPNVPCDPQQDCPFRPQFPHLQLMIMHRSLSVPPKKTQGAEELLFWEFSQEWGTGGGGFVQKYPPCPVGSGVALMSNFEQLLRGVWKPETNEILHMSL